ncbi:hypothetical protein TgHK011_000596 [Trichoderma gracile]|nr:hypothetical protein TgHK011_000596 [Trichoderma gracile]
MRCWWSASRALQRNEAAAVCSRRADGSNSQVELEMRLPGRRSRDLSTEEQQRILVPGYPLGLGLVADGVSTSGRTGNLLGECSRWASGISWLNQTDWIPARDSDVLCNMPYMRTDQQKVSMDCYVLFPCFKQKQLNRLQLWNVASETAVRTEQTSLIRLSAPMPVYTCRARLIRSVGDIYRGRTATFGMCEKTQDGPVRRSSLVRRSPYTRLANGIDRDEAWTGMGCEAEKMETWGWM